MRRRHASGFLAALLVCAVALPAGAQDAGLAPLQSTPRPPAVLASYDFHLQAIHLGVDDPRFKWDADFGGDLDLVDYGVGRLNFLANYEAVLGDEFRDFDVNQASYTLDFRASIRNERQEIAAVFNHVSRHISDRPRPAPVDWNMMGAEYWRTDPLGPATLRTTARALFTIVRSSVDYDGQFGGSSTIEAPLASRAAAIGRGVLTVMPVDGDIAGRDRQWGTRLEGGVRLAGDAAAVELVLGYERRIDAHPLEAAALDWFFLGFRFVTR
jgi:hypothetical protein